MQRELESPGTFTRARNLLNLRGFRDLSDTQREAIRNNPNSPLSSGVFGISSTRNRANRNNQQRNANNNNNRNRNLNLSNNGGNVQRRRPAQERIFEENSDPIGHLSPEPRPNIVDEEENLISLEDFDVEEQRRIEMQIQRNNMESMRQEANRGQQGNSGNNNNNNNNLYDPTTNDIDLGSLFVEMGGPTGQGSDERFICPKCTLPVPVLQVTRHQQKCEYELCIHCREYYPRMLMRDHQKYNFYLQ